MQNSNPTSLMNKIQAYGTRRWDIKTSKDNAKQNWERCKTTIGNKTSLNSKYMLMPDTFDHFYEGIKELCWACEIFNRVSSISRLQHRPEWPTRYPSTLERESKPRVFWSKTSTRRKTSRGTYPCIQLDTGWIATILRRVPDYPQPHEAADVPLSMYLCLDNIPVELLKHSELLLNISLFTLILWMWKNHHVPTIFKKEDRKM